MQSIYSFRDADVELFSRVKKIGLEIPGDQPLILNPVSLTANFRTDASLVTRLNEVFGLAFEQEDAVGSHSQMLCRQGMYNTACDWLRNIRRVSGSTTFHGAGAAEQGHRCADDPGKRHLKMHSRKK